MTLVAAVANMTLVASVAEQRRSHDFFLGGPIFRDLRRPTRFGGGGGSNRNFPGSP